MSVYSYHCPVTGARKRLTYVEIRTDRGHRSGPDYRDAIRTGDGDVVEIRRATDCGDSALGVRTLRGWPAWAR